MGKKAQVRREKNAEAEKQRKVELEARRREREPWIGFWRRFDFWAYIVVLILIIAYPFMKPYLPKNTTTEAKTLSNNVVATIHTSKGDIDVELFKKDAPKTVDNFVKLSRDGFYNGLTWHRVVKGFVIQGGDPNGDGSGGPGYTFEDEINQHKVIPGALAMANSGPNTNGSQFFIVTQDPQPHLDGKHTVFGQVTVGMDIVHSIESVKVDSNDRPEEPVYITSIEIR